MKVFKSFKEGFVGSFSLAAAIVMAIVGAASAFVHADQAQRGRSETASRL